MQNIMLWRYLVVSGRSAANRVSTSTIVFVTIGVGLAILVISLFWLMGALTSDSLVISLTLLTATSIGIWGGLNYATFYRPSGWWWLSKSNWLWLKLLPAIGTAILIVAITVVPYYLANTNQLFSLQAFAIKIIIALVTLAVVCIGATAALTLRTATRNPYLRMIGVVLAGYLAAVILLIFNYSNVLHQAIQAGLTNTTLIALLFSLGIFGMGALALQLAIDRTRLAGRQNSTYWASLAPVRLLNQARHPAVSYLLTQLVFYVRSSFIHRRVIAFFLLAFSFPYIATTFAMSALTVFALELSLVWLLAQTLGNTSGQIAAADQQWLATVPITFAPALVARIALVAVVISLTFIGSEFFPIKEYGIVVTAAAFIALTTFGYARTAAAPEANQLGSHLHRERVVATGTVTSLIFVILPVLLYGITSAQTIIGLMILWLIGGSVSNKFKRILA